MNKDLQIKNTLFYSIVIFISIIVFYIFLKPQENIRLDFVHNFLKKVTSIQNIAPQRLFINAWRITKNSYVDNSLNNQDWSRWRNRYTKHIKTLDDANIAINTMLTSLNDPYTKFLQSELFSKQKMILGSKITGIGVEFNKAGDDIVINHVLDNSPAQSESIMAGDTIVAVNGTKTSELNVEDIVKTIESDEEDTVELTIKHNDTTITKKLKKRDIPIQTMNYKITDDNIGIITLTNIMGEKAVEDFKEILSATNDTKGIIIDLRNNYGGILANAIEMSNYMLNEEKIVSIESRVNAKYQIYSDDEIIFKDKPIVILINNLTASAAEIMTGTLKDNKNAIIIGEHSFGKNSIQQIIPMPNATGLILTTDKYILPNGEDIYNKGIVPDIIIKKPSEQMQKAIEIINGMAVAKTE
jgi:carboxyl-terminal processing protease